MKQKIFYIVFIFATIFLLIFINRKTNINQSISVQDNMQQPSLEEQGLLANHQQQRPLLASSVKPSVTFIKKTKTVEKTILPENKKTNISSMRPKNLAASSGGQAASSGAKGAQTASEKPESGITKIGKRPSIERVKELNAQGVVLQ
ncbi:MAG: hypothetical protein WC546_02855 [Candidatus Omnitrophota bacterium]